MKFQSLFLIAAALLCLNACAQSEKEVDTGNSHVSENSVLNPEGKTIQSRFNPPPGYSRKASDSNSFAHFLRHLPLKKQGSKVKYYNGELKTEEVYEAVVDMEISKKDLQQCADAVMRLRAEYFFSIKDYHAISFNLTNGFRMDYITWSKGNRVLVKGNETQWKKLKEPSHSYATFREYLDFVFTYAGTLSLSKSLHPIKMSQMNIGDVFIYGGSPGHAVMVIDMAENDKGEKVFMLAQSYMPAQETQILKNLNDASLSPWYTLDHKSKLYTPQWTFDIEQLKTW